MSGESVFTVVGSAATEATRIGLAEAGLRERDHLQEWVIANPHVLGPDVKVVAFEFGSWTGAAGERERDRLDVLGLDHEGRLVVVELKRDRAPDTVDMQALKYAALVSRFTRGDLDKVHARHLTRRRGEQVDVATAAAELDEWATISEETLRLPRLILMATEFPKTTTATVVFLHQRLALDVRLIAFQAYRTGGGEVLVTVSQHYPPPDVEEFVLSPEVSEAQQARSERQTQQREASTVSRLLNAGALEPGQRLEFRAPSAPARTQIEPWLDAVEGRRWAAWQDEPSKPLKWEADGQSYSPTGLAMHILAEAMDKTGQVQGPLYWVTEDGVTLVDLASAVGSEPETPFDEHVARIAPPLQPLLVELDALIMNLGPDVTRRSRSRYVTYYAVRKLCDVLLHGDHLSVYIRGLSRTTTPGTVVVGGTEDYVHTQIRDADQLQQVGDLLRRAYEKQPR